MATVSMTLLLPTFFAVAAESTPGLTLVKGGRACAVLVIADKASLTAKYAAQEFAEHVKKATGVGLPVVTESKIPDGYDHRVYIGVTQAAAKLGIDPDKLANDVFILRTAGSDLYVLGKENPKLDRIVDPKIERSVVFGGAYPRAATQPCGTLYGVYDLLHRFVGVRWLWPGELGTFVPRAKDIVIEGIGNETHAPKLKVRDLNWQAMAEDAKRGPNPTRERWGYTYEGLRRYNRDLAIYMARHGAGRSERHVRCRHEFTGWWEKYGKEHPEWFMLNKEHKRGPLPGESPEHVAMCVSNPDLHRFIVEEYWDGPGNDIALGEVDKRGFCRCDACRSWDVSRNDMPDFVAYDPVVSNRYARFWNAVAEMAVKKDPNVVVTTFLYWNYMPAPAGDVRIHPNVYGEFVPWSDGYRFYPMSKQADQWLREQWLGWRKAGMHVAYRPNILCGGYVMPDLSTRQLGEFWNFIYQNGMREVCFNYFADFSTRGPMLYMIVRLARQPDRKVDDVLEEYYSGFGPAGKDVRDYFEYWEKYSTVAGAGPGGLMNPTGAHMRYPLQVFKPAEEILSRAMKAAKTDPNPEFAKRVEFLQFGLQHAKLAAQFMATLDPGGKAPDPKSKKFQAAQAALRQLIDFRRRIEPMYVSDLWDAAREENSKIRIDELMKDIDKASDTKVDPSAYYEKSSSRRDLSALFEMQPVDDPWREWRFQTDPSDLGQKQGWYAVDFDDADWKTIPVPIPWAKTWVGEYLGYGWYRTQFAVPEAAKGKTLTLLFKGVDEQAWVYVNGKLVGEHSTISENTTVGNLWDAPFLVTVKTSDLKPDQNVLAVRVHSSCGAAGIWKPVSVYIPKMQDGM